MVLCLCVFPIYMSKNGTWYFPVSGNEIWDFFRHPVLVSTNTVKSGDTKSWSDTEDGLEVIRPGGRGEYQIIHFRASVFS